MVKIKCAFKVLNTYNLNMFYLFILNLFIIKDQLGFLQFRKRKFIENFSDDEIFKESKRSEKPGKLSLKY